MKVTKKDKMVLLVLLFVLIVGIFLMYGVIPANDELKEVEAKELELETQLKKLQSGYNINNPKTKISQMEDMLHEYYTSLDEVDDDVFVNSRLEAYFYFQPICKEIIDSLSYDISLSSTFGEDSINSETIKNDKLNDNIANKDKVASLLRADATFDFKVSTVAEVSDILATINDNSKVSLIGFTYTLSEGKIIGQINIKKYYIESTMYIPLPLVSNPNELNIMDLVDAPSRPVINPVDKTISFETIPYANYYEIYEVFYKDSEFGGQVFSNYSQRPIITNIQPIKLEDGTFDTTIEVSYDGKLNESKVDEKHYYVVVAVGNYEQFWYEAPKNGEKVYYRTIMSKYLANNKFEVA